jgi:hypothetical protein
MSKLLSQSPLGTASLHLPQPRPAEDAAPPQGQVIDDPPVLLSAPVSVQRAMLDRRANVTHAIVWLTAHIWAVNRVVYPAAERYLPAYQDMVRAHRVRTRELEHELRLLHERVSGDGRRASVDPSALSGRLVEALSKQTAADAQLVEMLSAAMPNAEWAEVLRDYGTASQQGPTRPHPHVPHSGVAGGLASRALSLVDRALDVMDSRIVHRLQT